MDADEGVLLEQDADPAVLSALVPGLEQPGIAFLTGAGAGLEHRGAGRIRVVLQVARQPELQGMHARDVGAIGQREAIDGVGVVQAIGLAFAHGGQMALQEGGKGRTIGLGPDRAMEHRETLGAGAHFAHEPRERTVGAKASQLAVEFAEERAAFPIGEAGEVRRARRVRPVLRGDRARTPDRPRRSSARCRASAARTRD